MADIDVEELKEAVILIVNEAHEDGSIECVIITASPSLRDY